MITMFDRELTGEQLRGFVEGHAKNGEITMPKEWALELIEAYEEKQQRDNSNEQYLTATAIWEAYRDMANRLMDLEEEIERTLKPQEQLITWGLQAAIEQYYQIVRRRMNLPDTEESINHVRSLPIEKLFEFLSDGEISRFKEYVNLFKERDGDA
jgi:hypothetical protein